MLAVCWVFLLHSCVLLKYLCPSDVSFQVTIPLGFHNKCPASVSFIARNGGDRFLLDTVQTMYATLQEQVDIAATSKLSRNVVSKEQSAEIAKEKVNDDKLSSTN